MRNFPESEPDTQLRPASREDVEGHEHPTLEQIAAEAYAIYMANGANDGRDLDDWLEAERRLREKRVNRG